MSQIKLSPNASGTGVFTVASPATNTDRTLTLPDNTGTLLSTASTSIIPTGGPAFSAYFNGSQTVNDNTSTVVALNTEEFDTNSCFNASTYRFTPTVAGYYQISGAVYFSSASVNFAAAIIGKNGSALKYGQQNANGAYTYGSTVSAIIYLNGTTDYIELWAYQNSGVSKTLQSSASPLYNYMSGALVRGA